LTTGRRFKRFLIDPEQLGSLLKGTATVVDRPLPADAALVTFGFDADRCMASVVVHSSTYDPAPPGPVPISDNGPIIAEDRP
jgi:hypothetical protein